MNDVRERLEIGRGLWRLDLDRQPCLAAHDEVHFAIGVRAKRA